MTRIFTNFIPTQDSEAVLNHQTVSRINMKTCHGTERIQIAHKKKCPIISKDSKPPRLTG